MYLGIDLGTSSVKAALIDDAGAVHRTASAPLEVSRPYPTWSEQDPEQWWSATQTVLADLKQDAKWRALRRVGLTGQMHGATLLDEAGRALRPAILWNDGRSASQCRTLEVRVPDAQRRTGNRIMPGFTAPKLLWVAQNEPEIFAKTKTVLLPKDYIRYRLTGDFATDMSDAAGTMWLDVGRRDWSDDLLAACGLNRTHMPALFEGPAPTGELRRSVAAALDCGVVPVVAGAGDNAAGAIGVGITEPGQGVMSLGTSGTYFVVTDRFVRNPQRAVHSFCHALPDRWHVMSVALSAASCLAWLQGVTGGAPIGALLTEAERIAPDADGPYFLPYLAGERTPHDDPHATGAFVGLTHETTRGHLARAVLEGVAFAMADGADALHEVAPIPETIFIVGGGAQSAVWIQTLADALQQPLYRSAAAEVGPALGAALLARGPQSELFPSPRIEERFEPRRDLSERVSARRKDFYAMFARVSQRPPQLDH